MKNNLRLLSELFSLAVEVNESTEKAVFIYLHGHVRSIDLRITKGKLYDDRVPADRQIYNQAEVELTIRPGEDDAKILSGITFLKALLPCHDKETDECFKCSWKNPNYRDATVFLDNPDMNLVHHVGGAELHPYPFGRHPYDSHGIEF